MTRSSASTISRGRFDRPGPPPARDRPKPMIARVNTFAVDGVASRRVWVEADIRQGLPAFTVVGLADLTCP